MAGPRGFLLFTSLILALTGTEAARILLMPFYHYSHVNLFATAARGLKQEGHEVTMLLSDMFASSATKSDVKSLLYKIPPEMQFQGLVNKVMDKTTLDALFIFQTLRQMGPVISGVCELVLQNDTLQAEIQASEFDLVIADSVPLVHCFYVIPYKLRVPYISLNAVLDPWSAGVPAMAAAEPLQFLQATNQMTFLERLMTAGLYFMVHTVPEYSFGSSYYVKKYAPELPPVSCSSLYRQSSLFLVNHEITCLDYPRISAPNYQFIGGCSATAPKPLPADLQEFADDAKDGLIVITFGSMPAWQKLWKEIKHKMIYALEKMPKVRAVALYSLDEALHEFPSNIKILRWLPQNDLLGHPNTRLFVTHGGNNGQLEAAYHGVPMLVMPIAGDQIYNGIRTQHHGYGHLITDRKALTGEELYNTLNDLLTNQTYSSNIGKCSRIIRSQPSTQEKLNFWVNHVLEFGGAHLRPPTADMPFYQMFMLDIVLFLTVLGILGTFLSFFICRLCFRKCCRKNQSKHKEKKQ